MQTRLHIHEVQDEAMGRRPTDPLQRVQKNGGDKNRNLQQPPNRHMQVLQGRGRNPRSPPPMPLNGPHRRLGNQGHRTHVGTGIPEDPMDTHRLDPIHDRLETDMGMDGACTLDSVRLHQGQTNGKAQGAQGPETTNPDSYHPPSRHAHDVEVQERGSAGMVCRSGH